jgi:HTH-type transcriptional regulator, transcriptional repressor of NAD biosynthesis genes
MVKAFVFGKFLPFHKGHEAMMNFALTKCDFLTIMVCCSDNEGISGEIRKMWIEKNFADDDRVMVKTFAYLESELPNTSESSPDVARLWADVFKTELPDHTLLITSEKYGDFVAEFMNIQHLPFDVPRALVSVSGTAIRNDLNSNWNFLPESVKPYFAIKVVILGTESTGKTTLTENLARHFNCTMVLEAGRELIADSNSFTLADLHRVAAEHTLRIRSAALGNRPLIIIDTDVFITKSYCRFVFGEDLELSRDVYESNRANLYLYLKNDVPHFQDGTRLSESDRNLLDKSHRQTLKENNISFVEIGGNWDARYQAAIDKITALIES